MILFDTSAIIDFLKGGVKTRSIVEEIDIVKKTKTIFEIGTYNEVTKSEEKTILVTGGNRGIGKAVSRSFAETGYDIIFTYNSGKDQAQATEEELRNFGVSAKSYQVDLSSRDKLEEFSQMVLKEVPQLFALINNAGIYRSSQLDETSNEEWDQIVSLNMSAPILLARNLHNKIIDRGSIVNISSVYGFRADAWAHGYQGTKAALIHLTRSLAKELAPRLRVNCIAPGFVRTDINRKGWTDEEFNEKIRKMTPMARWGEPEDIAKAVNFLVNPSNSFITGQTLVVDGGIGL